MNQADNLQTKFIEGEIEEEIDEMEQQVVTLEVSHKFPDFLNNYLEDNDLRVLNGKWSISSIKVVDGDGVLELDKNVKNIKFLLELEVSLVENIQDPH